MSVIKTSQLGLRILREMPSQVDNAAHAWLLRGGFLYQHAAGIYCFSPMMKRVEKKVSDIIAEEITRFGGAELRLPILQSADLWKETGRWDVYSHERLMFQLHDRKEREFGLSPTAEEAVCDLAKHTLLSSAQLPVNWFQQNFKFRDELRPRSGLLRSREFIMMDAYSFDIDDAGLDVSYEKMRDAYHAIFDRMGLEYIVVQADSGAIGGTASEEFMSISEGGEDTLLYNDGYAANDEKAQSQVSEGVDLGEGALEIVETGDAATIEDVAKVLGTEASALIKTLIYDVIYSDRVERVMLLIRGDYEVNEIKVVNYFKALSVKPSSPETVSQITGVVPGWVGPFSAQEGAAAFDLKVLADLSLVEGKSYISGCCVKDKHAKFVQIGREFPTPEFLDIRLAKEGDIGLNGQPLQQCKGIEVGHIFKLGDKYSKALNAGVTDHNQQFQHFKMGCYGIGTTRVIAAVVDQNCDIEKGIVWPMPITPFHVQIIPLKEELHEAAIEMANEFSAAGIECLLEDRKGSVGSLLKDSDIVGIPLRIVLGRDFQNGQVEFLNRLSNEKSLEDVSSIKGKISELIRQ